MIKSGNRKLDRCVVVALLAGACCLPALPCPKARARDFVDSMTSSSSSELQTSAESQSILSQLMLSVMVNDMRYKVWTW